MRDLPLVSIVVVSYNQGRFIRENLDSIKAQTYPNIELIVADDASPDNSVEIFNEWLVEHNYPAQKIYHIQNTGLATVLNECIAVATGKYIKLIAADDFLHPESIEKCVAKLEELGEEYGMVFTDINAVNSYSEIIADIADYNSLGLVNPEVFRRNLKKNNQIAALSVLMRTSVLKTTGPYNSEMIVEDYQKWLQINDRYYIAYIPQKLCYYRQHEGNISKLKEQRITNESLWLTIKHDPAGEIKEYINERIQLQYYRGTIFNDPNLINSFLNYPFRNRTLAVCIQKRIPFFCYRILKRIKV